MDPRRIDRAFVDAFNRDGAVMIRGMFLDRIDEL
jgi:hypothetical protein